MEAHIHEWANLLVRWIHFIVGVAWIGASFYFNWLENRLDRSHPQESGIAGNLWAVHGGGFYHLKKFTVGPAQIPASLHWFKWEAYTTWMSGFTLLVIVYYFNTSAFLLAPGIDSLTPAFGIAIGVVSVLASWFIYDLLCRSRLRERPLWLGAALFAYFTLLAALLSQIFTGRAAYIHVGAAIGTIMVANVFFVIIPAQKEMVAALAEQRPLDPRFGHNGLLRSRHNNYFTLPVLFVMISNHFPSTYAHHWNWLILVALSLISIVVRHYFNIRHLRPSLIWILPASFLGIAVMVWLTRPLAPENTGASVSLDNAHGIIQTRCVSCHADVPTQPGFAAPPAGVVLESAEQLERLAERIYQTVVVTRIMPLANLTGITDEERQRIAIWYTSRNSSKPQP